MKKLKTVLMVGIVALMSVMFVSEDAFARGGRSSSRSSSSRSSSSRKSYSKPSANKPSARKSWSQKKKTVKPSSRKTAKKKMTPAQQKSLETAKKNGTAFKSKSAAQSAFKTKHASKYKSKYSTKPATRPSHIPQNTNVGGVNYNVTYNQGMGGYGYMNTLGTFMMYDMMSDSIMRNRMMAQQHYIVQPPVIVHRTSSFGGAILGVLFGIVILAVVFFGIVHIMKN